MGHIQGGTWGCLHVQQARGQRWEDCRASPTQAGGTPTFRKLQFVVALGRMGAAFRRLLITWDVPFVGIK